MKEVTKEEFWNAIYNGKLDVHPCPVGEYPYTSKFKLKNGKVWGEIVQGWTDGIPNKRPVISKYFIASVQN